MAFAFCVSSRSRRPGTSQVYLAAIVACFLWCPLLARTLKASECLHPPHVGSSYPAYLTGPPSSFGTIKVFERWGLHTVKVSLPVPLDQGSHRRIEVRALPAAENRSVSGGGYDR